MTSLRVNLLKWLIAPLLIINLLGAALTYWLAWTPAQTAFDQSLADTGWAIVPRLSEVNGEIKINLPQKEEQILRIDHFNIVYFVVRNSAGEILAGDPDFPVLPFPAKVDTPETYDASMRGEPIRIIGLTHAIGNKNVFIGVAETLRKRNNIRSVIVLSLLLLEGLLTAVTVGIVWFAITRGLFPLKKMQTDLSLRKRDDLSPMPIQQVALELHPLVSAMNNLLHKAEVGAINQQNFLANVAHQLRTPLAGLKLQIEWLAQRHQADADTTYSTDLMLSSTNRMIRQTNQLLALARAEPSNFIKTRLEPLSLDKLVEESIQHFIQESDKKQIDLGFDLSPTVVMGDRFLMRDLIDNLIDNAIRYSPEFGRVTVSCVQRDGFGVLSVEDSGPGIAASERELIFNRFYRLNDKVTGSGLGLAIVRDIATDHNATIVLNNGEGGLGTVFTVQIPKA